MSSTTQGPARPNPGADPQRAPIAENARIASTNLVLTKALRLYSVDIWVHTSLAWTANALFCLFLLFKLNGTWAGTSYWIIFLPLLIGHGLHIPLCIGALATVKLRMLRVVGPPPPPTANTTWHAQYISLKAMVARSYLVDTTSTLIESLAIVAVVVQFAQLLSLGTFRAASMRVVFSPVWVAWVICLALMCTKHRRERWIGSFRDFTFLFLLMVAFKVDNQTNLPWQVIFVFPWVMLSGALLMAVALTVSLSCSFRFATLQGQLMTLGLCLLLWSTGIPHFAFCRNLVARLDQNVDVTLESILIPGAVGWTCMWLSCILFGFGLRERERVRMALLDSGAVWTAQEAAARHILFTNNDEQRRVDAMTESQIISLAIDYMKLQATQPPTALKRMGPSLFKVPDGSETTPAASRSVVATSGRVAAPAASDATSPDHMVIEMVTPGGSMRVGEGQDRAQQQQQAGAALRRSGEVVGSEGQQRQVGQAQAGGSDPDSLPSALVPGRTDLATLLGMSGGQEVKQQTEEADDGMCVICCDAPSCCVLLECGHGGFCRRCGHLMMVRPPNACPTCRQTVHHVMQLVDPRVEIGGWTEIRMADPAGGMAPPPASLQARSRSVPRTASL